MTTLIIDYGMGNLGSVRRAFEECGASVMITPDPCDLKDAARIVLPGVGAFGDGMENLRKAGWIDAIRKATLEDKTPFLGICLGMQLLADSGEEGGEHTGLGLIPGHVKRLQPSEEERIPHIGWNEVHQKRPSALFDKVSDGTDFYFVHSYHFAVVSDEHVLTTTPYCGGFASAIARDTIFGVQFHPEKSSKFGFQVIRNFLAV